MGVLYQFNGYNYSTKNVLLSHPEEQGAKERIADTPGKDGGYTMATDGVAAGYIEDGVLAPRRITLSGQLIPAAADNLITLWDAFKKIHIPGRVWQLYVGDDTRYLMAECVGFGDTNGQDYPSSIPWQLRFLAADPLWRAVANSSANLAIGTTAITTVAGTYPAPAILTLPISGVSGGGVGQFLTITLSNGVFSKVMTVNAPAANGTLIVDLAKEIVTLSGADRTDLFSGVWWKLQPLTTQNVVIAQTGGLSLTGATIAWNDRYL